MTMPGSEDLHFRRVVIRLQGAAGSTRSLEIVARFAKLFGSGLSGIFLEDPSLIEWSASPMARHFSRVSAGPSSVSPETLSQDFAAAAAIAKKRLLRIAGALGLPLDFTVAAADWPAFGAAALQPSDLPAVVEPADPSARPSYPFAAILRAMTQADRPVLYVPHGAVERPGPIVSMLREDDEAGRAVAQHIARRTGEELVARTDAALSRPAADDVRERLIVLSRQAALPSDAAALCALLSARRVPVFIVGAPRKPNAPPADERTD